MRNSNQRSISANKPIVTITSTVYDRRALDLNSDIPLINSLNHLTYLTSNSAKVRETVASDGALERLVSILHDCHLSLKDCIEFGTKDSELNLNVTLPNAERIRQQKKLALCAWKWTLSFQCLVLTGTRGTELIRRKVVSSGIISVLATVLDNYLLYYANYDHLKGEYLKFELKSLNSTNMYFLLSQNHNESFEQYIKSLVGKDTLDLSMDDNLIIESLISPTNTKPTDFGDVWNKYKLSKNILEGNIEFDHMDMIDLKNSTNSNNNNADNFDINNTENAATSTRIVVEPTINDEESEDENCFLEDIENRPSISSPRNIFLGRIIPKQDDLIWSLQLLAFISKYTYMKPQLQNVELVKSLSFRTIINRVEERLYQIENNMNVDGDGGTQEEQMNLNGSTTAMNGETYISPKEIMTPKCNNPCTTNSTTENPHRIKERNINTLQTKTKIKDKITCELNHLIQKCNEIKENENTIVFGNNSFFNGIDSKTTTTKSIFNMTERNNKEFNILKNLKTNWTYDKISKHLDQDCWSTIKTKNILNIFPLVEKFTVTPENAQDVIYWSSVIMRNSCRKNEVAGVRQCANFTCGKWESYPREFAKCRRCKRTKYCSRKCQLQAWTYHRFWCHEVNCSSKTTSANTEGNTTAISPNTTAGLGNTFSTTIANETLTSLDNNINNNETNETLDDGAGNTNLSNGENFLPAVNDNSS
ncbi:MYND-type zinc finger protein Mub1p [Monosporozyma servazzii]